MKIMTAMYTLKRGGSYDRFLMMLEALSERGCEIHCLSLNPIPLSFNGYNNHVVKLRSWKSGSYMTKMAVLFLFPLLAFWIGRKEKVDLFIAFGTLYAFIESIPKKILRRPMVTFIRGDSTFGMQTQKQSGWLIWLNRRIERMGINFSDTILSVSDSIQEDMKKEYRKKKYLKWKVIPNHIPSIPKLNDQDPSRIRKKYGIPEYSKILVTAGIINRGKNLELLFRALSQIDRDDLFLLIIGEASTEADLKYKMELFTLMNDLKIGHRVRFMGWIKKEELWEIFRSSDLFILASKNEGTPNVVLEALGCDLPCFGSQIGGIKDILHYAELIFDPNDEKTLLDKIDQYFIGLEYFNNVRRLCNARKEIFLFDWKERVFTAIMQP